MSQLKEPACADTWHQDGLTCSYCGSVYICEFPASTSPNVSSCPLPPGDTRGAVWTPEVHWPCCSAVHKKSAQWRHQRDNPAMSQIFTGAEPLMGARNEIWTKRRPHFNHREEFGEGAGRDLWQGSAPKHAVYYEKKLLWAKMCFLPVLRALNMIEIHDWPPQLWVTFLENWNLAKAISHQVGSVTSPEHEPELEKHVCLSVIQNSVHFLADYFSWMATLLSRFESRSTLFLPVINANSISKAQISRWFYKTDTNTHFIVFRNCSL